MTTYQQYRDRFERKVDRSGGPNACHLWLGGWKERFGKRYGKFRFEGKNASAHRVAMILYVGPIPAGTLVLHSCDAPLCVNHLTHLRFGTSLDNMRDRKLHGAGFQPGMARHNAKLTNATVLEARRLHGAEGWSMRAVARHFGVSLPTIRSALQGRTWTHV